MSSTAGNYRLQIVRVPATVVMAIELCRDLNRKAAAEYVAHGITLEDVSVAAVYSAYDIAHRRFNADAFAAVEFLRTSADLMERQLLATTSVGNDR